MPICRLCEKAEATKTNSHIFPHFLIKTAINKDGSKQRDYELTFSLSENEFVETFFGRSITLDTIQEYKGRELTAEELKKQNPFCVDHLFCPSCEKRISVLEEYYSKHVYQRLLKNNADATGTDSAGNQLLTFEKVSLETILLFVYSIFFRASVSSYHGFDLRKWERKLKKALNKYLDEDINKLQQKITDKLDEFPYFPVVNTHFKMTNVEDPTQNFVTIFHSETPYFVYLNDVAFQMFMKEKEVGKSKDFFFGINDLIKPKEAVNTEGKHLKVVSLTEQQLKNTLNIAFGSISDKLMNFIKKAFKEIHSRIFHRPPSEELTHFFMQTLISQDMPMSERYGVEAMAQAMYKSCKIYYQIP